MDSGVVPGAMLCRHVRPDHHLAGQRPTQVPGGPAPPAGARGGGTTLVEGYEELALALDAGVVPAAVYYCPELMLDPDASATS